MFRVSVLTFCSVLQSRATHTVHYYSSLYTICGRNWFCMNYDKAIDDVWLQCHFREVWMIVNDHQMVFFFKMTQINSNFLPLCYRYFSYHHRLFDGVLDMFHTCLSVSQCLYWLQVLRPLLKRGGSNIKPRWYMVINKDFINSKIVTSDHNKRRWGKR